MKWLQCAPMKRLLSVAILAALALPSTATADTEANVDRSQEAGTWVNGVKVGLAFSTLGGDVNDNVVGQTGMSLAYFFSYRLGNGIAIQPEILVAQKGADSAVLNESGRDADLLYTYIDVPVFGRYNLSLGNGLTPYAYGGPMLGINIDSSRRVSTNARDWDAETNNIDVGVAGGLGLDYLIKNNVGATIDARFTMGFLDADAVDDDANITNRAFVVMLGIWK